MKEIRTEIEIEATPEEIWAVLMDLDRYANWNPLIYRAEGKVALGEKVNISVKTASRDLDLRCSVVKVEPNREFSWKFHVILPFLIRGEHIFRVEPIDEHRVRFIDRETFNGLLVPLLTKYIETKAKSGLIAEGEALKRRVEH